VQPAPRRTSAGIVAIAFGLLMFIPLLVLGHAIDWPASLDLPATELMPLIQAQAASVELGYSAYLLYSILFFPAILLLGQLAGDSAIVRAAVTLAGLSVLARAIGIIRWLTVQPELAQDWGTTGDPSTAIVFDAVNSFGGAVGELIGVSLLAAAAIALLAIAFWRTGVLPRWVAVSGLVASAGLLLPWLEVFGTDPGSVISISVALVQIWFLSVGSLLLFRAWKPAGVR
jgi:hypothetical protein